MVSRHSSDDDSPDVCKAAYLWMLPQEVGQEVKLGEELHVIQAADEEDAGEDLLHGEAL